ncbi:hypothetical protein CHS0354_021245 [Potamilus streckersoni]|uniref:Uncharacterized protein n=1 Tax=Potamilus streckersoni TaxID=2493646 RepID=A0AAE0S4H3_9BIVA|nr:hypothetical protein CHS0354_021245 [Potamilus streckersoni]
MGNHHKFNQFKSLKGRKWGNNRYDPDSDFNTFSYDDSYKRKRRDTSDTSFEVETAVYVDQKMYEYMENDLHATTTEKKIELVLIKWNGVIELNDLNYITVLFCQYEDSSQTYTLGVIPIKSLADCGYEKSAGE